MYGYVNILNRQELMYGYVNTEKNNCILIASNKVELIFLIINHCSYKFVKTHNSIEVSCCDAKHDKVGLFRL